MFNSSGCQIKEEIQDYLYKKDTGSYEGLAECICSDILTFSNIKEFVKYTPEKGGCRCKKYTYKGVKSISLYSLLLDEPEDKYLLKGADGYEYVLNVIYERTGLKAEDYLSGILQFDEAVLNQDRHFGNIEFLIKDTGYNFAPIFDNGDSFLLKDLIDSSPIERKIQKAKSKPFSTSFGKQLEYAKKFSSFKLELYHIPSEEELMNKYGYYYPRYVIQEVKRILDIHTTKYLVSESNTTSEFR